MPVTLAEIGGLVPTRLFLGDVTIAGATITRGAGSNLGSFLDEGFAPGQLIRITIGATAHDAFILSVTAQAITLTATFAGPAGAHAEAAISRLTRVGLWEGGVSFDPATRSIVRSDNTGWLADGFLEGQRVRVCTTSGPAVCGDFKVALIRGLNATKDERLEFTSEGGFPFTGSGPVRVTRLAAQATFTPTNWYQPQTVALAADTAYTVPPTRAGVKVFPVSTHLVSKLRGPLSVEGGPTAADRSLKNGVKLPGEADGPLFGIAAQPPEGIAIDVLNIFNDSSEEDTEGTMTSTNLRGLGMAGDLTFAGSNPFGEPATFPGGISYGAITFSGGQFQTDGQKSTIEVLNLLLGSGNDRLDIQGTLDPAPVDYTPVTTTGAVSLAPTATGGTVTRSGFDWAAAGFVVGQLVYISGLEPQTWRLVGITGAGQQRAGAAGRAAPERERRAQRSTSPARTAASPSCTAAATARSRSRAS